MEFCSGVLKRNSKVEFEVEFQSGFTNGFAGVDRIGRSGFAMEDSPE